MPCSGPNSATKCTPGVCARRSTSLTRSRSTPVGLVISPTCLPLIRSSRSCSSTSIPVLNPALALPCAAAAGAANGAAHANSATSAANARQARSITTLLPFVVGDLRLRRLAAGMDLKIVHVPAAAVDLVVGPIAELDVTGIRRQCDRLGPPAVAGARQQIEYLPVDAVGRSFDAAVIVAVLQPIPGPEGQLGIIVRLDLRGQ